jgi:uncharacterized protein YbjT (DUF2867 family)
VTSVLQLLERGHHVIAIARNPKGALKLQQLSVNFPVTLRLVAMDVSDASSIKVHPRHAYMRAVREDEDGRGAENFQDLSVAIINKSGLKATWAKQVC